jgi:hypothetical protein
MLNHLPEVLVMAYTITTTIIIITTTITTTITTIIIIIIIIIIIFTFIASSLLSPSPSPTLSPDSANITVQKQASLLTLIAFINPVQITATEYSATTL